MTKERNIPSASSPLAGQPVLTPNLGPLKVGEQTSESEGALPPSEEENRQEAAANPKPKRGRSRGGRRPPPAAADAIPTTIRFDPEESDEVTLFVMELKHDAHRRNLDKAEVIRELLRLAREHPPTKKALLKRLK